MQRDNNRELSAGRTNGSAEVAEPMVQLLTPPRDYCRRGGGDRLEESSAVRDDLAGR